MGIKALSRAIRSFSISRMYYIISDHLLDNRYKDFRKERYTAMKINKYNSICFSILSVILCLILSISLIPIKASAADNNAYVIIYEQKINIDTIESIIYTINYDYVSTDSAIETTIDVSYIDKDTKTEKYIGSHTFKEGQSLDPVKIAGADVYPIPISDRMGSHSMTEAVMGLINSTHINLNTYEVISRINEIGYLDNGYGIYKNGDAYLSYLKFQAIQDEGKTHGFGGSETYTGQDGKAPLVHTVTFSSALADTKYLPSSFTKTEGKAEYIPAREPYVEGYHFDYYSTQSLGSFLPGDIYTHNQNGGSINLHAHFKSYVRYDDTSSLGTTRNDLISTSGNNNYTVIDDGQSTKVTRKPVIYLKTKDGDKIDVSKSVIFVGYNDKLDGTGSWYGANVTADTDGSSILNESTGTFNVFGADKTLYAQYRLSYSIYYNGNNQTTGDNFYDAVDDPMLMMSSENVYTFKGNPFTRKETEGRRDHNLQKDIQYEVKYAFEGYSLDKDAYFKDKYIYMCTNQNRPDGLVMTVNIRDYLSECLSFMPITSASTGTDYPVQINNGYITITNYAVWDRYPEVWGYDLSYSKELLKDMDSDEIYNIMMIDTDPISFDKEDSVYAAKYSDSNGNPYPSAPEILFVYFSKDDFMQDSDFGSVTLDLSVTDTAGNTSTYRITVHVTTDGLNTSKGDITKQASYFTRYIDEDNYKKSFNDYGTANELKKSLAGLDTAHNDGALEPYSKWLNDDGDAAMLRNIMREMDSEDYEGYADSITLSFDDIMSVRKTVSNNGVGGHDNALDMYLFDGTKKTTQELKETVNNDTTGYKRVNNIK